jgi:hypothetical protein
VCHLRWSPQKQNNHVCFADPDSHTRGLIFAGTNGLADVWYANVTSVPVTWVQSSANLPQTLYGHAMSVTDAGEIWVTFGRITSTSMSDALSSLSFSSLISGAGGAWRQYDSNNDASAPVGDIPPTRLNHAMVAVGRNLWLMGGQAADGSVHPCDMYILDTTITPVSWRKVQLASSLVPEARFSFSMQLHGKTIFVSCTVHV